EGRRQRGAVPAGPELDAEIFSRLEVLEYLCTIPDNYRCALLLKEGSGLTVERTAFLMGVSKASLRSILYRARGAIDSRGRQSERQR
ncbi:MAG: sigma factor-like helix-turn-helix DNA-binding protein, partial [Acidimicrobiia bacterium]